MLSPLHRVVVEAAAEYPSWKQAAKAIGLGETKFRQIIHQAQAFQQLSGETPDIVAPPIEAKPRDSKPRVSARSDGGTYRLLVVGDVHDSIKLPDKSRLTWIARHAAETKPDKIIQIGDFGDWHSVSQHEPPGSLGYACKPSFRQEIESMEEALTAIYKEIGSDIPQICVEGNHEFRIQRWEESHPAVEGGFYQQLQDLWARFGWKAFPYGEWVFIGGCGFIHTPMNGWGKPYGGKNPEATIANDALFSICYGHTHKFGVKKAPKIGPNMSVEIINVGSAMPTGYLAPYAGTATTGWSYGVVDLTIQGGHITSHHHIGMDELEDRYGD